MLKIYNKALQVFNSYYALQVLSTDDTKKIKEIDKKYLHTMEVVKDGSSVVKSLDFNETFVELSKLAFLNHDIGRFKQILKNGLIAKEIPSTRVYDEPILDIVDKHVDGRFDEKDLLVLISDLLKSADAIEFFSRASEEEKAKVINTITQIVQDVDRLDIYHQILEGRWIPMKVDEPINPKVMDMFYNGEYLNMVELKKQGLWNANVGELVRLSFVNQIRLLSVAKLIHDKNILMKMKELRQNPFVLDAFDFMQSKLEEMINNSDGITICKKK